ncbi:hypothetical protein ABQJ48_24680 [Paraburkholderia sp. DGU8]
MQSRLGHPNGTPSPGSSCSTEVAEIKGDVVFLDTIPGKKEAALQAGEWYDLGELLMESDVKGAEQAYRKALELSPEPFYEAYVDPCAMLCEEEGRCEDALCIFCTASVSRPSQSRVTARLKCNTASSGKCDRASLRAMP